MAGLYQTLVILATLESSQNQRKVETLERWLVKATSLQILLILRNSAQKAYSIERLPLLFPMRMAAVQQLKKKVKVALGRMERTGACDEVLGGAADARADVDAGGGA